MVGRDQDTKTNIILWFQRELGFSLAVATELFEKHLLRGWKTISELDDDQINRICQSIWRDSKESITELAVTQLKLATFWVNHQLRTNRPAGHPDRVLVKVTQREILLLREQKRLEDNWCSNNKEPDYTPLTLNVASAPKVFEKMKTILTRICGVQGAPLAYVIRHKIEPPSWRDDNAFGEEDSAYASHDEEMIARAPIIQTGIWRYLEGDETYEANGPFALTFVTD
jgi:hypothetical protein